MTREVPFEIDPETLNALVASGEAVTTLDVREDWEIQTDPFDGNLHIPLGELPASLTRLPKDESLVIVCQRGHRSLQVTAWLRSNGFDNATSLRGGVKAWKEHQ